MRRGLAVAVCTGSLLIACGGVQTQEDDGPSPWDTPWEHKLPSIDLTDLRPPDGNPQAQPPAPPGYSEGACPTVTGGPTKNTAKVTGFVSSGVEREFRFIVPDNYDGSKAWPVVFGWHWLNASSGSFVDDAELESAAEQMEMLVVLPDSKKSENGDGVYIFDWPFFEDYGAEEELVFFEDLLSCVNEQYHVDLRQVHGIGVSAGGLWITYLSTTTRIEYFASVESLSGGLGEDPFVWSMDYVPQTNKFPAIVLWGGQGDWLGISFHDASTKYRDELVADGHFVVECIHDSGHAVPPIDPPAEGVTRFWALWEFMKVHPYGTTTSPWAAGLPEGFPEWCAIASP